MAVLSLTCFVVSLIPSFDSPKWRPVRGLMFMAAGLSAIAFIISIACFKRAAVLPLGVNIAYYAVGGYAYLQGAILYVLRIPERCKPGSFDICGASHQIFHFAVITGCVLHFIGSYKLFIVRENFECPIWSH